MTQSPNSIPLLGQLLVQEGTISAGELMRGLAYKQSRGGKLGQALVGLGLVSEGELARGLRSQGKTLAMRLHPELIDVGVAAGLGEDASRKHKALAVNRVAGCITVAMDDPQDVFAIDAIQSELGSRILPVFADIVQLEEAIEYVFKTRGQSTAQDGKLSLEQLVEQAHGEATPNKNPDSNASDAIDLGNQDSFEQTEALEGEVDEKPIVNLVRSILLAGFKEGASDIHIEPRLDEYAVRFRVDGSCYEKTRVPRAWATRMMVRIKLMGNLDIAQRRLPQDGRASFRVGDQRVDLRVTTTPTVSGEGAVLRILDGGRELKDLNALGLRDEQIMRMQRMVRCREGFVLATGPTGSGKTTTLYALLKELATPERKIVTLEDPVENVLDGVTQINACPKVGLTFAKGLRSVLRQDPDIVLVGEIRDKETASIAVEASMTGHIVLSTLHTVGAAESVTRLLDMSIAGYQLGDTLKGVVAQRLLRKICTHCREQAAPIPEALRELSITDPEAKFYEGRGCSRCRNTGFKGRVGIYEILLVDAELRSLIQTGATTDQISAAAHSNGIGTLRDEGLRRALAGEVTLADVLSVTS